MIKKKSFLVEKSFACRKIYYYGKTIAWENFIDQGKISAFGKTFPYEKLPCSRKNFCLWENFCLWKTSLINEKSSLVKKGSLIVKKKA